jgi:hypothetical protein
MNLVPKIPMDWKKKLENLYLQLFFSFLSSFLLGMMAPLHLVHLDLLVSHNSLGGL